MRNKSILFVLVTVISLAAHAAGPADSMSPPGAMPGAPPPAPPAAQVAPVTPAAQLDPALVSPQANDPRLLANTGIFAGFMDPFDYDPRGRRDPFAQPVADVPMAPGSTHGPLLPLQAFELSDLRVVGILWNVRSPKAMIKDPSGKLHIVGTNTKVGPRNGYIAVIREGELVVVETIEQEGRLVSSAQVVKIAK